ncbi:alpha/beta fold hydrolase [Micromonospora lupini]|uniref:alpha/beta fold hydrolase n=1 Tax=Micromonospora lupini TaxID=285679 RepID=UPI0033F0A9A5
MRDLAELRQFARLHARGQGIADYEAVLAGITSDEEGAPGSWACQWSAAASAARDRGDLLGASARYAMARFPYVDGPARAQAQEGCVRSFDAWRRGRDDIEPLEVTVDGCRVRAWAAGLSAADPRPLLVVTGGIVSVKEQWAPVLAGAGRIGMAVVVTEMPGVGENAMRYTPQSAGFLSALLDSLGDRADTATTILMALSFSGHLALRCAAEDARIRGVVTVGAPAREFFLDPVWWPRVPRITVDTLSRLTGTKLADSGTPLEDWALPTEILTGLRVPLAYVSCLRDEIIPGSELALLRDHVRDLRVLEYDDVHGAPAHVAETRLWTLATILRMAGRLPVARAGMGLALGLMRARRRLPGATRH